MAQTFDAIDFPSRPPLSKSELLDPNSVLSPYIPSRDVYHCPADNYTDKNAGGAVHVRSYSMNSAVGTLYWSTLLNGDSHPVGSPVEGGWLNGSSYDSNQKAWRCYGTTASFIYPGPSDTYVIIDENPYSINDGSMATPANASSGATYLVDFPSGNHGKSAGIAFADGHSIVHKRQDNRTFTPDWSHPAGRGSSKASCSRPTTRIACIWLPSPRRTINRSYL